MSRVYIEMRYTIAIDEDFDHYGTNAEARTAAINSDPDFALDHLHNGPHLVVDIGWEAVEDDYSGTEPWCSVTTADLWTQA
jgi:hypothetical protein